MDAQQRIHAYIVCGDDAGERERLAYSLALDALGGRNYAEKGEQVAHPDLHEYSPDGAEIKVGQARQAREEAQVRPNEAERQVFIFHEADRMNAAAQNALLATIEEPPTPCLFIFVCQNQRALLATIRSRCGILRAGGGGKTSEDTGTSGAARLAGALMLRLDAADAAEAVTALAKLKGDAAVAEMEAARRVCLRAAVAAAAGSDDCTAALEGADRAAKCLDYLNANVSAAQVAAWIVSLAGQ